MTPAVNAQGQTTPAKVCVAYVGVGANLGDTVGTLTQAARDVASLVGVSRVRISPLYRSAPVDAGGPDYVNAVLELHTTLAPEALLRALQSIEDHHGRQRPYRNAPRSLDLDLLLYDEEIRSSDFLTLPHPRMHQRAFVLIPLHDLAPSLALPQGSWTKLLAACRDQRLERIMDAPGLRNESLGDEGLDHRELGHRGRGHRGLDH